ncbi:hypothetical protein EDB85DRAFT_2039104, partial [Lactarius pseudohatsudake]
MRAAREWGGALQPGAAPPSPWVGARGQRANRNAQKRRPSPGTPLPAGSCARARTGDHAEAPPLPPPREPGSPPYALQGCNGPGGAQPGGVQIGRRAPVARPPLHTGTTRIHVPPLCAKRKERGSRTGRVRANPERCPSHSCTGATRERTGSDWEGVCATGCARASGEWGAHPLRIDFCAEQRAGARGHKRRHAGGLYGMERTQ